MTLFHRLLAAHMRDATDCGYRPLRPMPSWEGSYTGWWVTALCLFFAAVLVATGWLA